MNNFSALDTRVSVDKKESNLSPDQIHIQTAIYYE